MKTLKLLVLVLSLAYVTSASANNGGEVSTKELSDKVKQSITTPASIKEKRHSEKITVYFTVNTEGQVIEVNARTTDKKAKDDLEKQFLGLRFEGLNPCVQNSVDIHFLII
jgi:hypothetical protein